MTTSSDIINAIGLSPGIIAALTGSGTTNYTAQTNLQVNFHTFYGGGSTSFTVNGVSFLGPAAATILDVEIFVAKGQTLNMVATVSSGTFFAFVSARSIA